MAEYQFNEDYWNNKWPKSTIIYGGRSLRTKTGTLGIDVTEFMTSHDAILTQVVEQFKLKKDTPNNTAWAVQKWIVSFMTYLDDAKSSGADEFWQFPFEAIQHGIGDCEDGAILMANLLINAGIPVWRVKVAAGYVQEAPTAPQGGHAYCLFLADDPSVEKKLTWKILDWCIVDNKRTIIQTPNGGKRISKLKEGDWIIGYDEENQKPSLTQVKKLGNRKADNIYKISFEHGDAIYATGEHPFYVKGEWKNTENLQVGDEPYYVKPMSLYHMMHDHKSDTWREESHKKVTQTLKDNGTYDILKERQIKNNVWTREDVRKKLSENNCMKRPEIVEKNYGNRENNHQSGPEKKFIEYCIENNLPVDFFGNAKFWIRTKLGSKNPDFKVKDEKKLIEVSCEWMNNIRNWDNYKKERTEIFEEKGFKTIFVLYDNHYNNIIEPKDNKEINQFVMNGNKITNIKKIKQEKTVWNMHCTPHNNYFVNGNLVHNCYYEDSQLSVEQKPSANTGGYKGCYKNVWFTFNSEYAWAADDVTIKDSRLSKNQTALKEQVTQSGAQTMNAIMSFIRKKIKK